MHDLIRDIGDFIFVEDQPVSADAIMVLGGSFPEAGELAADLWKQGLAPTIFIGGGVSIKQENSPALAASRTNTTRFIRSNTNSFKMFCG